MVSRRLFRTNFVINGLLKLFYLFWSQRGAVWPIMNIIWANMLKPLQWAAFHYHQSLKGVAKCTFRITALPPRRSNELTSHGMVTLMEHTSSITLVYWNIYTNCQFLVDICIHAIMYTRNGCKCKNRYENAPIWTDTDYWRWICILNRVSHS